MSLIIICITIAACAAMLCNADISITITHRTSPLDTTPQASFEDIQEVYDRLEKEKEHAPSFTDVIDVINKEFGGINYGED
jgi:hypothetical protein